MDPNWRQSYRQVAAILSQTVRASSAVECMNSILRMHQSRHRTLTQGLLDLKRLYWNTREFRAGQRKGCCPYEHLGLKLRSYDFWSLLHVEMDAALAQAKENARSKAKTLGHRPRPRLCSRSHLDSSVQVCARGLFSLSLY